MWFIWCMTFLIKFGFLFYLGSCSKKRIGKILNGSFIIIENISLHPTLFSHQPQTIKGTHKLMFGVTWVINAICPPHVGAEEEFSGCYGYSTFFFFFWSSFNLLLFLFPVSLPSHPTCYRGQRYSFPLAQTSSPWAPFTSGSPWPEQSWKRPSDCSQSGKSQRIRCKWPLLY